MGKPVFFAVDEVHEDHVTLAPSCSHIGGDITGKHYGPFVADDELFESEELPIADAIKSAARRAENLDCDVAVLDPQKLWDPAWGHVE